MQEHRHYTQQYNQYLTTFTGYQEQLAALQVTARVERLPGVNLMV